MLGTCFDVSRAVGPSVADKFLAAHINTLGQETQCCNAGVLEGS